MCYASPMKNLNKIHVLTIIWAVYLCQRIKLVRMFRTIFTVFFVYFLYKIARVIIDPLFDAPRKTNPVTPPASSNKPETPKAGEYIDYEEIK